MTMTDSLSDPNPAQRRDTSGRGRQPNLASTDPYAVLGLMRGASLREIKRAYFSLVREYSPEEHPDTFKIIRAAYEKLRLTDVKAETDLFLFQSPAPWTPRKRKSKLDLEVHFEDIVWLLQQHGDLGQTDFRDDYKRVHL
jgi:curved DNA-binding protein CbpA